MREPKKSPRLVLVKLEGVLTEGNPVLRGNVPSLLCMVLSDIVHPRTWGFTKIGVPLLCLK